ncbi:MAG: AmmeMemoRadiSam system radical SAM enzyme [Candidatus Eisenbacteria bacterium]|nr:AmmeMemoRadiSam system radical SAM enzyme [Candidatus Eisenbacteria bacterium]
MTNRSRNDESHAALWWRPEGEWILCALCPRGCRIGEGDRGFCAVRRNEKGRLLSDAYGRPTGFGVDPIEKKPLYHFLPGSAVFSFGTLGCNLGCRFCQNWDISRSERPDSGLRATPGEITALARREGCVSIAYTYNEPIVFGEFVIDCAAEARRAGIRNVLVTNGFVEPEARAAIFRNADAANVDLKAFTDEFYREQTGGWIEPVLETLLWLRRETEVWLEVTTLLIPGLNDDPGEIRRECAWIAENLGADTPLHFSAFHPDYRMTDRPRTAPAGLREAREIAIAEGLRFVYVGNILDREGSITSCPGCGATLIERDWHSVRANRLRGDACPDCGAAVPGVFE